MANNGDKSHTLNAIEKIWLNMRQHIAEMHHLLSDNNGGNAQCAENKKGIDEMNVEHNSGSPHPAKEFENLLENSAASTFGRNMADFRSQQLKLYTQLYDDMSNNCDSGDEEEDDEWNTSKNTESIASNSVSVIKPVSLAEANCNIDDQSDEKQQMQNGQSSSSQNLDSNIALDSSTENEESVAGKMHDNTANISNTIKQATDSQPVVPQAIVTNCTYIELTPENLEVAPIICINISADYRVGSVVAHYYTECDNAGDTSTEMVSDTAQSSNAQNLDLNMTLDVQPNTPNSTENEENNAKKMDNNATDIINTTKASASDRVDGMVIISPHANVNIVDKPAERSDKQVKRQREKSPLVQEADDMEQTRFEYSLLDKHQKYQEAEAIDSDEEYDSAYIWCLMDGIFTYAEQISSSFGGGVSNNNGMRHPALDKTKMDLIKGEYNFSLILREFNS